MRRFFSKKLVIMTVFLMTLVVLLGGCGSNKGNEQKQAEKFPTKPIKIVTWATPGAPLDIFARKFAQIMEKYVGQPVIVENKTGGGGGVAMSAVQALPADGYTLLAGTRAGAALLAGGQINLKADDFDFLVRTLNETTSITVSSKSPFKTIEDFLKYAKENPEKLKVGGVGTGTFHHSVMNAVEQKAGIKVTWVPFEGGNNVVTALLGGKIDAAMMTPSSGQGQIEAGELKVLAVSTAKRSPYYPDVPTFKEKGVDIDETLWRGIFAKKGIPKERLDILLDAFDKVVKDPDWQKYLKEFNQEDGYMPMATFDPLARDEVARYEQFLRIIGKLK